MYWSPMVRLQNKPQPTVDVTMLMVLDTDLTSISVMLFSMPLPMSTPENVAATMIRKMVWSIPTIPLVDTKALSDSVPVSMLVLPNIVVNNPLKPLAKLRPSPAAAPPICAIMSGCENSATIPPSNADRKSVCIAVIFKAIQTPVNTGMSNSQADMLNEEEMDCVNSFMEIVPVASCVKLNIRNIINVITNAGMVVIIMYLIWVNNGVPVLEDARTVVSDRGDILSPK